MFFRETVNIYKFVVFTTQKSSFTTIQKQFSLKALNTSTNYRADLRFYQHTLNFVQFHQGFNWRKCINISM